MGDYDTQQVCLNGHQITASYHRYAEFRAKFCHECGAMTIHQCQSCKKEIKGYYHVDGFIGSVETPVPTHCEDCGTAYPWAGRLRRNGIEAADPEALLVTICQRFHLVACQLRHRREDRKSLDVSDEYDVQDLMHSLLHLAFDDIRPEEWTPSYAGKAARMDFLLKNESIVVEAKKTRSGLGTREVGDQLIVDIARYQGHPGCKTLFCFVYDPEGRIANPRGIETDLTRLEGNLSVKVFIVPRGH